MNILSFEGANTMAEGPGLPPVPCLVGQLPDGTVVRVVKWSMTAEEIAEITLTESIYVVHSGLELYPYTLSTRIP